MTRRTFIAATAAVAGTAFSKAFAGPFEFVRDDEFPIPADKKFAPEWLASLRARGEPTVYRYARGITESETVDELKFIGMPIGGICAGQLYLGGDGRLWHWDIFNQPAGPTWADSNGPHYAKPVAPASPIEQGFAIKVGSEVRRLDKTGFPSIEFKGQYPIAEVTYRDEALGVEVVLEAMAPFIPMNEEDSGLPLTIMGYTVKNTGRVPIDVEMAGWLENAVAKWTGKPGAGVRVTRTKGERLGNTPVAVVDCSAQEPAPGEKKAPARADIVFEDWEKGTYDGWTVTGKAFGEKPRKLSDIASYQGDLNAQGEWTVNTHETRGGEDVGKADTYTGTLTSRAFKVERRFIGFRIGGGNHAGKTCVNLLVDGGVARTAAGKNNNRMRIENWDVRELEGKEARIQIVDEFEGGWGQVGCDEIVFCDEPMEEPYVLQGATDYGTLSLACVNGVPGRANIVRETIPASCFEGPMTGDEHAADFGAGSAVGVARTGATKLVPKQTKRYAFVVAWNFPNPWRDSIAFLADSKKLRRHYATAHPSSRSVLAAALEKLEWLRGRTRLWRNTWYDSTLPHWFLDRVFATACTPATSTCFRFETPRGPRFYGWEGTYCCAGTCTHVWNYGQTLARIFPALERNVREMVDFDMEFDGKTGLIHYRGEAARSLAIDGQCGTILRAYREHTMCEDNEFLKKAWPNVKKAIRLVMDRDEDKDGILDGAQYNTLDTTWYGQISWITTLYLAVMRAGAAMAKEIGDKAFHDECVERAERGFKNLPEKLFNGEYFVHVTDPKHPEANSTGSGCHSDMLFGQFFTEQLGLPRLAPVEQTRSALRSLYRYNVAPDVGAYRKAAEKTVKGGRWYAMPGEGGMIVCTWPKGGSEAATGKSGDAWAAMYFNESWTGFEHHVAAQMFAEGMVEEGLVIERLIHDRHHAAKRNPYNEIECSSHYARAMSAYGAYISMCGYVHHGPSGLLGFDPKLTPEDFRCAFTAAGGWGSFKQTRNDKGMTALVEVKHGRVRIANLRLGVPKGTKITGATATGGRKMARIADAAVTEGSVTVRLDVPLEIAAGESLEVSLAW